MKKTVFITMLLMVIAIGNVRAYDLMGLSPSHHVLYLNILDAENHAVGVTYPCLGGGGNYYYNHTKPQGDLIIPEAITIGSNTWTVTEILDHAFYNCPITSVEIPNTVTSIGLEAFRFSGLLSLTLPSSVDVVGFRAFNRCDHLRALILPEKDIQYAAGCFLATGLNDTLVLPEGITTISHEMFGNCGSLKKVKFPSTLISIGDDAFEYCSALREIYIPSSVTNIGGGKNPFRGTEHVASISVEEGNPVFYSEGNCIIERSTKTIVAGCRNSVIPDDIVAIGNYAFERGVAGPLTLPASVNTLGVGSFYYCPSMNKIYSFNHVPPTVFVQGISNSFAHVSRDIPVYVPSGCAEAYQNAPGWDEFENIVEMGMFPQGAEWYYEIEDDYGNITYQYLEYTADTTINGKEVVIIIRTNTLYDKESSTETSREYLYEEDGVVYWWNSTLGEFATLYDFGAEVGDEWEIKVGTESLTMHVDEVLDYEYEGQTFRMLRVSDENDLFSGDIICEIGHLTSFFPEQLMNRDKNYSVEGIRCFWQFGQLIFKQGEMGCDEVHSGHYWALDERPDEANFTVYPNPTHVVLFVETFPETSPNGIASSETFQETSLPGQTYRITNLMGQTLMTGQITAETQQIDVSKLPEGMYFITIGNATCKFVVR